MVIVWMMSHEVTVKLCDEYKSGVQTRDCYRLYCYNAMFQLCIKLYLNCNIINYYHTNSPFPVPKSISNIVNSHRIAEV